MKTQTAGPRRQKRYTEQDLVERIDADQVRIKKLNEQADIYDRFADVLRDYPSHGYELVQYRDKALKCRKRVAKIESVTHYKFKEALAKIRTLTLPGMGEEKTVTL